MKTSIKLLTVEKDDDNTTAIRKDIFNCVVSNGYNCDFSSIYIMPDSDEVLKAYATVQKENKEFVLDMRLSDSSLCNSDKTIVLDMSSFKHNLLLD